MGESMDPREILKRPYARILTPEDGEYTAEILEFPGCVAFGSSADEALKNLEEVAAEWIAASIEQGQEIPDPLDSADFSGRLVLRMPKGLHQRAALFAELEGVSLNHFIVTSLAEAVGERSRSRAAVFQPQINAVAHFYVTAVGLNTGYLPQVGRIEPGQLATASSDARIFDFQLQARRETHQHEAGNA